MYFAVESLPSILRTGALTEIFALDGNLLGVDLIDGIINVDELVTVRGEFVTSDDILVNNDQCQLMFSINSRFEVDATTPQCAEPFPSVLDQPRRTPTDLEDNHGVGYVRLGQDTGKGVEF